MQEGDAAEKLPCEGLDVGAWKRDEAALFEEVEDGEAEEGRDDADVAAPVEAVAQLDAAVAVRFVRGAQGLQDAEFDAGGVAVLDILVSERV